MTATQPSSIGLGSKITTLGTVGIGFRTGGWRRVGLGRKITTLGAVERERGEGRVNGEEQVNGEERRNG